MNVDAYISTGTGLLGYNMYAYCGNSPVIRIDSGGRMWQLVPALHPRNHATAIMGNLGCSGIVSGSIQTKFTSSYYDSSAYNTYTIRSYTAHYDASLGGYYSSGVGSSCGNIGQSSGAVTVTDSMATQPSKKPMKDVVKKGKAGEDAVPGIQNHERIPSITGAAYRIPDRLNLAAGTMGEIKNYTGTLSYTAQLRDFVAYAQDKGLTFYLYTNATLSGPLQKLVDEKIIVHCPIKFD